MTYHGFLQKTGGTAQLTLKDGSTMLLEQREGYYYNTRYWCSNDLERTYQDVEDVADDLDAEIDWIVQEGVAI